MADLFQSEFEMGSLRRGVQDGETLWNLLAEDGTITVVPDPGEAEIESAQKELGKLGEEEPDEDPEKEAERQKKIRAAQRTAGFQAPIGAEQLPAEEEEEEREGNGRRRSQQPAEKAEARS